MFFTIIIFVAVLSVLVFVHELGHFLTARRLGVKAEEFGFGFPPRLGGVYRSRSDKWRWIFGDKDLETLESLPEKDQPAPRATVYSLNWLPIGGFVKIKGENGGDGDDSDSFSSKSIWKRVLILSAGVIMNAFLAWILFSFSYLIGMPQANSDLSEGAVISGQKVMVMEVTPGSPAAAAGLEEGDVIRRINNEEISTESSLQEKVAAHGGEEITLAVERADKTLELKATPFSKDGGRATIGIAIYSTATVRYGFFQSFWEGIKMTVWVVGQIFTTFYGLLKGLFGGNDVSSQLAGPVGIATITGQAARLGFSYLLQFVALLSVNLAVLNILPFPALDGGRIVFLIIEKIGGRPVKKEVENLAHNIGFILLMVLVVFITYKDIAKLF